MSTETLLPKGSFSNQSTHDEYEAEFRAERKKEAENRARTEAERLRLRTFVEEAERVFDASPVFDSSFLTLKSVDAHPGVVADAKALRDARAAFTAAESSLDAARASLAAHEAAAARGHRDGAALLRAHDAIKEAESGIRIAAHGVADAETALGSTKERIRATAYVHLRAEHRAAITALNEVLKVAEVHSQRAAVLEDASRRLLRVPYDVHGRSTAVVRPLPASAWRKDFAPKKGFYGFWRDFQVRLGVLSQP